MIYNKLASNKVIEKTIDALKGRGINVELVRDKKEALNLLFKMIPPDSDIMTAGSTTLEQIGLIDIFRKGEHKWKYHKDKIFSEKDPEKRSELRKNSSLSDYFLGSVHAVTENGEVLVASNTGSQIPSYAFTSKNVIWIVGTQKIVKNISKGLERIRKYTYKLEDKRMKDEGYSGTSIGKILIFENEAKSLNREVTLIFVNEKLGF